MSRGCLEEIIRKRRSIRKYKDVLPPEECIEKILWCALWSPSPSNIQPVRYIRIESDNIRERLYQHMCDGKERLLKGWEVSGSSKRLRNWIDVYYTRYSQFMFDAPVIFAVGLVNPRDGFYMALKEAGIENSYDQSHAFHISLGLSLSHFILEAEELGLATCILTTPLIFLGDLNKVLGVKDIDIRCFVTLGFPAESPEAPKRLSVSDIYLKV